MKVISEKQTKQNGTWSDVKKVISNFGHEELVNLLQICTIYHQIIKIFFILDSL